MRSIVGFYLALIGGVINILGGLYYFMAFHFLNKPLGEVSETEGFGGSIGGSDSSFVPYLGTFIFILLIIAGILLIISAFKMKEDTGKSIIFGGVTALVVSILSFNILGLIGGIFGIVQARKVSTLKEE